MKAVLMSVNKPHTDNIHTGAKRSELRTLPPNLPAPFKVYMYETKKGGGCGKVVSEWICKSMTEWLMYMGIPAHLSIYACVSNEHIQKYCNSGEKNITEMEIDQSSVYVYEKPRELSEFYRKCKELACEGCEHLKYQHVNVDELDYDCEFFAHRIPITRPPQNWCYVEVHPTEKGGGADA